MTNEDMVLEIGAVYAEPDGCLYTFCPGAAIGCVTSGLMPFGENLHLDKSVLGELTKVIASDGHVLVENIIDHTKGYAHPGRLS